jgi:hypothetical protein
VVLPLLARSPDDFSSLAGRLTTVPCLVDSNSTRTESFVAIRPDPEAASGAETSNRSNHNV